MNTYNYPNVQTFLKGFISAFDLSGKIFIERHEIPGGFERDRMMLHGDWMQVGNDVKKAVRMVIHE